jgi:GTP-binding protein EngB required for normal cell division
MSLLPLNPQRLDGQNLSVRLEALAELVRIGRACQATAAAHGETRTHSQSGGFDAALLDEADAVLKRAGDRLRLSGNHTVIALAGGTGSGKSTLFNALSGATLSPEGVTRPMTRHAHACVWGMQGSAALLDWLGVQRRYRFSRATVLDSGEADLDGLILLDLPDFDSVVTASMTAVDRLAKLADMVIWVLDPQKYADAALHDRYLIPLAGHAAVFTVVLNQIDSLAPQQAADCAEDLRRLLDREGLADTPVFPVSAHTGAGIDDLRDLLAYTIAEDRTVTDRISADIDAVIGGFAAHGGPHLAPEAVLLSAAESPPADDAPKPPSLPPWELIEEEEPKPAPSRPPWEDATPDGRGEEPDDQGASVPDEPAARLTDALAQAVGLAAVAQAMTGARRAQAARLTGWPVGRLLRRHRDPRRVDPAVGQAQQSEVDNALTVFAETLGDGLPGPWPTVLRDAARSNAGAVPRELAEAVQSAVAESKQEPPGWWRLIAGWQWLLTVLAAVGIAGAVVIGVARLTGHSHGLIGEVSLVPWLVIMAAAMLVLGFVTAVSCRNTAVETADKERGATELAMRDRVAEVTHDLVLRPTGAQIAQYERFRAELAVAAGQRGN